MANLEKVQDAALRERLGEAHTQLRTGKPTDAVRTLADIFLTSIITSERASSASTPARRGRRPLAMGWPNLGANLSMQSLREGKPEIVFTRERFAMSEAITYYEFTVEAAIALEKQADSGAAAEDDRPADTAEEQRT